MFDLCISNESPCWETSKFKISTRLDIPVKNGERCISSDPEMIFYTIDFLISDKRTFLDDISLLGEDYMCDVASSEL